VHGPIPNSHLKMAFVEWNQEVETFATKAARVHKPAIMRSETRRLGARFRLRLMMRS